MLYADEAFDALLEATYRRGPSDTNEFLRNGLRLAMTASLDGEKQALVARALGQSAEAMKHAYAVLSYGPKPS